MIHGPCGLAKLNSPCMKQGKCSKFFPKMFAAVTTIDEDKYPIYKRQNNGIFVKKMVSKWITTMLFHIVHIFL